MAISPADLELRQQAINEGKTTYTRTNGTRYTIRNLGNRRWRANYGGQGGRDEASGARKANRGSGTDSTNIGIQKHNSRYVQAMARPLSNFLFRSARRWTKCDSDI